MLRKPEESGQESGAALAARTDRLLTKAGYLANGIGALTVASFLLFLAPRTIDAHQYRSLLLRSGIVFAVYLPLTLVLGRRWTRNALFRPLEAWLRAERPATDAERLLALRYPLGWVVRAAVPWALGAVLFALLNAHLGFAVPVSIVGTTLLGGVTACALQYLLVERILRPVTARALAGAAPPPGSAPGVALRLTMTWALATGVPLLGLVALAIADVAGADLDEGQVIGATLFLGSLAIAVGSLATVVAARAVADPLGEVREGVERVERGDLDVQVPVDDGSEVGRLQAGFNRMAAGLRERERLREAFGAFVDPGLTERVLEEGTDLAGEEVEVSVMFLDVRSFTAFAERADARHVVARLNDLYEVVVPIILGHGGHANKFVGDGLLAVFGAPERLPDHADRAVAAALEIAHAVRERFGDEVRVGIGVNSGRVVAGTIGGGGRLDFTVIGDTVNTAARVEAATRRTGDDVLITDATRALLRRELADWEERPPVPLKGKREPIALYAPRAAVPAAQAPGRE
jgi:adenylate cyclase